MLIIAVSLFCIFWIGLSRHLSRQLKRCRAAALEQAGALYTVIYELQSENFNLHWKLRTWEAYAKGETLGIADYCIPANELSLADMHHLLTIRGEEAFRAFIKEKYENYLNEIEA